MAGKGKTSGPNKVLMSEYLRVYKSIPDAKAAWSRIRSDMPPPTSAWLSRLRSACAPWTRSRRNHDDRP